MSNIQANPANPADLGGIAQIMGLALLRAEMEALALLMPGRPAETEGETRARLAATDSAVEDNFDNLPV